MSFHPIIEKIKKLNFIETDTANWIRRLTAERDVLTWEIRKLRSELATITTKYRLAPRKARIAFMEKARTLEHFEKQRRIKNSEIYRLNRTLKRVRRQLHDIRGSLVRLNALEIFPTLRRDAEIGIGPRRYWLLQFASRGEIHKTGEPTPRTGRHLNPYMFIIGFNDFIREPSTIVKCLSAANYISKFMGQIQTFRFLQGFLYQFIDPEKERSYPPIFLLPEGVFTVPDTDISWALHTAGSLIVMYDWMGRAKLGISTVTDLARRRIYFRDHPEIAEAIYPGIRTLLAEVP